MQMFQYITIDNEDRQQEIWICKNCRKNNNDLILDGQWRLIDRKNDQEIECCCCGGIKTSDAVMAEQ